MDKSKKNLLNNLKKNVYGRIGVSKIKGAGVGVIAIKDIPKGVDLFKRAKEESSKEYNVIDISEKEMKDLPKGVQKIIKDFFHQEGDNFYVLGDGPNGMDISFYMNTSDYPNVIFYESSKSDFVIFKSKRKIKKGEELLINYKDFDF